LGGRFLQRLLLVGYSCLMMMDRGYRRMPGLEQDATLGLRNSGYRFTLPRPTDTKVSWIYLEAAFIAEACDVGGLAAPISFAGLGLSEVRHICAFFTAQRKNIGCFG
jgi:hypothetical protein